MHLDHILGLQAEFPDCFRRRDALCSPEQSFRITKCCFAKDAQPGDPAAEEYFSLENVQEEIV